MYKVCTVICFNSLLHLRTGHTAAANIMDATVYIHTIIICTYRNIIYIYDKRIQEFLFITVYVLLRISLFRRCRRRPYKSLFNNPFFSRRIYVLGHCTLFPRLNDQLIDTNRHVKNSCAISPYCWCCCTMRCILYS